MISSLKQCKDHLVILSILLLFYFIQLVEIGTHSYHLGTRPVPQLGSLNNGTYVFHKSHAFKSTGLFISNSFSLGESKRVKQRATSLSEIHLPVMPAQASHEEGDPSWSGLGIQNIFLVTDGSSPLQFPHLLGGIACSCQVGSFVQKHVAMPHQAFLKMTSASSWFANKSS